MSSLYGVFSILFFYKKKKYLTKSQKKKIARRRYRRFVDKVIIFHRKIHEQNQKLAIDLNKVHKKDNKKIKLPKNKKKDKKILLKNSTRVKENYFTNKYSDNNNNNNNSEKKYKEKFTAITSHRERIMLKRIRVNKYNKNLIL